MVAHRPSALANLDQVLVMAGGTMQAFGPKDEVLGQRDPARGAGASCRRVTRVALQTSTVVSLSDRK